MSDITDFAVRLSAVPGPLVAEVKIVRLPALIAKLKGQGVGPTPEPEKWARARRLIETRELRDAPILTHSAVDGPVKLFVGDGHHRLWIFEELGAELIAVGMKWRTTNLLREWGLLYEEALHARSAVV